MKGICASDLVKVAVAVLVDVDGLGYGRFQSPFVPEAVQSAKLIDLVAVDFVNLSRARKTGSSWCRGGYLAKRRNSPACWALVLR